MDRFGAYARILFSVSCAFLLLLVAPAGRADGVSFSSPTGDWGSTTHTFTIHGISITATAFNGGNLFAKNSDPDETGMGLAGDPSGDHEIFAKMGGAQDYIQLDLLGLSTAGFTNVKFQMGSTEGGDQWQVTACSTAGVSGSGPCSANASTPVRRPSSCALLLAGMLGLAGVSFARRLATKGLARYKIEATI